MQAYRATQGHPSDRQSLVETSVQAPGANSMAQEDRGMGTPGFNAAAHLACCPAGPGLLSPQAPAPREGAPAALPSSAAASGSGTKTGFCFNFPPVLSVIVQKASI